MNVQSKSDPSCETQVAANRYCSGSCELEFVATFSTEKSLLMNEYARQEKAMATKMNWACAVGRAIATSCEMQREAPICGRTASVSASMSARINAYCIISGSIVSVISFTCICS